MIDALKRLRAHCLGIIEGIDAILPQCEEWASPVGKSVPLAVTGKCEAISLHAIQRFRERTGSKKSDETVCNSVAAQLSSAKEMVLKLKYRVIELLAHGTPARYFQRGELMFVVELGVVVTVHRGEAERWIPKSEDAQ